MIIKITQVTTHPLGPPLYPDVSSKQLIQQRGGRKAKSRPKSLSSPSLLDFFLIFHPSREGVGG
jgi:hypothetical protein